MLRRHTAAGRRAALTALGVLALTGVTTAATAAPPPPAPASTAAQTLGADRPPAAVVRAMERDLKLKPGQAAERLVNEAEAGVRAGRLRNSLGKRFAGAWLRGATSAELAVATTHSNDVSAIQAQGAKAIVVKHPLAELQAVKDKLDKAATSANTRDTPVWYVDVPTNRVVVQAVKQSAATAFIKTAGVQDEGVAVTVSAQRPRPLADLVGGDAYYIEGSARCSIGFSITKDTQQGFASAGHCGNAKDSTTGSNMAAQGTFQASTFPGKDMSWVSTNSTWTATADVESEGGQRTQVTGSVQALVGSSICRSGSTTGWHCGTIEQHDTSVSYSEGTVDGVTETTVCAEPGDSGGPYISGSQAQGVTSGGSGDCTDGGTTFYQPINPILSDFGLVLKTATAQAGSPAPKDNGTATTWSAGRVYEAGSTVNHAGLRYQCLQSHQAQGKWSPGATPALWQRM
ncbi:alpha-lytic protease prodomain-containing protein [Streptomyces sp. NBC_01092]|uniref:alpha-lytic protease prodomain-containing protein n=1 Tax=Streptomyces sp. NBC_01092 TaxID=2903748 RepID=UPI0038702779|nr:alpha-lytic protease prodomain-containing protein [Streptomyces sp. NBC_01092]